MFVTEQHSGLNGSEVSGRNRHKPTAGRREKRVDFGTGQPGWHRCEEADIAFLAAAAEEATGEEDPLQRVLPLGRTVKAGRFRGTRRERYKLIEENRRLGAEGCIHDLEAIAGAGGELHVVAKHAR